MDKHILSAGLAALIALTVLPGCEEYGPFEPDQITEYVYETYDPQLVGDCDWLTDALGCYGSDCTIVGTEGDMEIGLNTEETEIRVDLRGEDATEWITAYGPVEGSGFTAYFSEEESQGNASASVDLEITGDGMGEEIDGELIVDMDIRDGMQHYSCKIEVDYSAFEDG